MHTIWRIPCTETPIGYFLTWVIRIDLKAWATRALKKKVDSSRENWWAERGSIRYLNRADDLEAATLYVRDGQDIDRSSIAPKPTRPDVGQAKPSLRLG